MATFDHARSNSFPTRFHPAAANVEDHLCRLKSADTSCSSTLQMCRNLASLKDLHESLDDLIQLPSVQQELSSELSNKRADEILDGSVRLLDVCSTAKDVLLHLKESIKELESALRRNKDGESSTAHDIDACATPKKTINKMITRCIRNLEVSEKKCFVALVNEEDNLLSTRTMLDESEFISFSVLESAFFYFSGSKDRAKQRGWSLVDKLVPPKRVHNDVEQEGNTHDVLSVLIKYKSCKESNVAAIENIMKQLRMLEMTTQELEEL